MFVTNSPPKIAASLIFSIEANRRYPPRRTGSSQIGAVNDSRNACRTRGTLASLSIDRLSCFFHA